jgi:hypothetical protein
MGWWLERGKVRKVRKVRHLRSVEARHRALPAPHGAAGSGENSPVPRTRAGVQRRRRGADVCKRVSKWDAELLGLPGPRGTKPAPAGPRVFSGSPTARRKVGASGPGRHPPATALIVSIRWPTWDHLGAGEDPPERDPPAARKGTGTGARAAPLVDGCARIFLVKASAAFQSTGP